MPICLWFSDDWLKDGYMTRHILKVYWLGTFPKYLKYFLISQWNDMTTHLSKYNFSAESLLKYFCFVCSLECYFCQHSINFGETLCSHFLFARTSSLFNASCIKTKGICLCSIFSLLEFMRKCCLSLLFRYNYSQKRKFLLIIFHLSVEQSAVPWLWLHKCSFLLPSDLLKYCSNSDMFPFWEKPKAALVLFQMIEIAILLTFPWAA